jgi:hypothetical protein
MSYFAKVPNIVNGKGVVTQIITAEQEFINSGLVGDPGLWWQTSYNTRGNVHYGQDGQPDGGVATRANYAGVGYILDTTVVIDGVVGVFYHPQPDSTCILNRSTWLWESPSA